MAIETTDFLQTIMGCLQGVTLSHGLYGSLFLAGLVGGVTHCAAMCGPFVISQAGNLERPIQKALLPYHLGRMTTYVTLAVLLATIVNLAFLFVPMRSLIIAPILMTAGVIFFITAFPQLATLFPWAERFQAGVPYRFLAGGVQRLTQKRSIASQYFLGILLGFMPCGLVVSALMAASTAPSGLQAGLAMAAFATGTVPALMGIGFGSQWIETRYPNAMPRIRQGMMIWSGLWLFALAGFLLI